jgi:phage terminase large subunit GpA-like protein
VTRLQSIAADVTRRVFMPKSKLSGSIWADTYGWIARGSGAGEHGPYSIARTPYMAEILDVMTDEVARDVVFNKPAQVGFTETINQFVGYCMKEDPSGVLVIQPDIGMAKAWMKERIDPMLAESPALRNIVRSEGGRRTSDDTMQRKVFLGGALVAVGANSAAGLRSRPMRRVLGDERSGWTLDARQQGDPWDLASERTATFWNAKRIQGSTPGDEETCPITRALSRSDWREYHVPCPSCGVREPFQWKTGDGTYRIVCERDAADHWIPQTARYLCTSCGVLIPETEKAWMSRNGTWVPRFPGREVVGFDLNGLISPWRTWADIITLWAQAQGNPEKLKVFDTHVLAKASRALSERIDVHTLVARMEPMQPFPTQIGAAFAAIDVQKDRIETLVIGVGAGEETWILDWQQHDGAPESASTWAAAWEAINAPRPVRLYGIAIDTGYLMDTAWQFVERWNGKVCPVIGVKGIGGRGRPWIAPPGATRLKRQRRPWQVGTDTAKDAISLRWRTPVKPGGPGAIHIADTIPEAFCDQVTAEELKRLLINGRMQLVWRLISRDRRNEGLDLLVYALAMLYARGPAFVRALGEMAAQRVAVPLTTSQAPSAPAPAAYGMLSKGVDW